MRQQHTIDPIYNSNSKVLILGSFPSITSRKHMMYYSHPQNRFWKVMSILFNEEIKDKKEFLLKKEIALWDVICSCDIEGSSDSSIKNVIPNNIKMIIDNSKIKTVFVEGRKAYDLYNKYILPGVNINPVFLSSTSSANAHKSLDDLVDEYRIILKFLSDFS